jgi:hypothetical protein
MMSMKRLGMWARQSSKVMRAMFFLSRVMFDVNRHSLSGQVLKSCLLLSADCGMICWNFFDTENL